MTKKKVGIRLPKQAQVQTIEQDWSLELEALEPIAEEDLESLIPSVINGACVNRNPQSAEIKDMIDLRRIDPSCQFFYLAKTIEGDYWFHVPCAERDHQLQQLIGDYRHKSHTKANSKKTRGVKKFHDRKIIKI